MWSNFITYAYENCHIDDVTVEKISQRIRYGLINVVEETRLDWHLRIRLGGEQVDDDWRAR
jgi:hypothetical protein